ncbi:universal stress protein [Candidatus Reidiella endopervernicosa]|uniref:Universal stress protein n=1 Tax=Candidatus Reidiella endopervernicosa TaxID=2738883 RepID=A0A6N0HUP2_9GAMM|nr:universal stress protein [Candidatus Reidiella endopervernicosa]QKQ25931.1 universal stress protein [Candidatus Reidiella endopervernicosa]
MISYKKILIAVEFNESDQKVVERAQTIAKLSNAQVSLVHVVEPAVLDTINDLDATPLLSLEPELQQQAKTRLTKLADSLGIDRIDCYSEVGTINGEVSRVAEEQQIDLIVLGSHGRHGLALLLGSTANAVLHHAPCDLLAVRIQD